MTERDALEVKDLAKPTVEAIKVIHWAKQETEDNKTQYPLEIDEWKWKWKVGEFYLLYSKLHLVTDPIIARERFIKVWKKDSVLPIPILHWEEIERVLEGMGYDKLQIDYANEIAWSCEIYKNGVVKVGVDACKSRQEAVMRAVIELAKDPTCHEK